VTLKQIEAHNFKSFRDLSVELGQLNVLIGANASGKSNFVQLLRFVRDITNFGLENALSIQGGMEYASNLLIGPSEPLLVRLRVEEEDPPTSLSFPIQATGFEYEFSLGSSPAQDTYLVESDTLTIKGGLYKKPSGSDLSLEALDTGSIVFFSRNGNFGYSVIPPADVSTEQVVSPYWDAYWMYRTSEVPRLKGLVLEQMWTKSLLPPNTLSNLLSLSPIYDLNAKLPKQTAQVTGKIDLEEDGSNLVIALKNILEDEDKRRTFSNLLQDILPFVSDIDVQRFADRFLHFRLRETYSGGQYLPASLMSDGTVNITALIVALYFSDKPLIVIEEPEKNIHPYLIARVANMLKDASRHKQIIVTTHNPEIVRNVALEDLLLVSRDRDGFSTIRRPAEDQDDQTFLSNEIGIDELFARNLLGA
jgi:predicted ATPase